MRALVMDQAGWKRHIMLDKETGLDPPGIKLRAAQGFDAADFFITGYWIWNKILQNLATIGYDPVCNDELIVYFSDISRQMPSRLRTTGVYHTAISKNAIITLRG